MEPSSDVTTTRLVRANLKNNFFNYNPNPIFMFDDQQSNNGVPSNLPMEPVDMFAGTEKDVPGEEFPPEIPQTPNALSAGLLKKKDASASGSNMSSSAPVMNSASMYEMKQPILGKVLLSVFLIAVLGGLGFGGWYFYNKFTGTKTPVVTETKTVTKNTSDTSVVNETVVQTEQTTEPTTNSAVSSSEVSASMNNDKILFGESVDTDKDGLDDVREKQLGTNPAKADSDADGLSDSDEVIIWKTNPTNTDTDGDSYKDGSEVFHGYNPLGSGKLFNVPTSTAVSVSTTTSTSATATKK